jgi:hypothetical protein
VSETIPTERCDQCVNGRRPLAPYTVEELRAELAALMAANDDAAAALRSERRRARREQDDTA